ncbi:MAG TPA: prepilin-type N-terminal cleavage/methylation domain-containing protein, partial [Chthonomonadales bacterium]|nr:prepilin-type N-terminal cleavage/methylation domain-containing protein [Chthonomonadales bacterium]
MSAIQRNSRCKRQQGFTLLEILVVLVVLLIGILAILTLFPGGFLTIQRTSELTAAQSLAQQQMDTQQNALSIPEAIGAAYLDVNGNWNIDTSVRPDDLTDFTASTLPALYGLPPTTDPYYWSDINRIRYVIGQSFRIPVPSPNTATGAFGAVYVLPLGPVYNQFSTSGGAPTDSLNVRGMPLQRTEQSATGTYDNPNPTPILQDEAQYAIDYDNLQIAFQPRVGTGVRQFAISFEYFYNNAGAISVIPVESGPSTVIKVPDVAADANSPNGVPPPKWQAIFNDPNDPLDPSDPNGAALPPNFSRKIGNQPGLVRGSEDVSRKFVLMSGNPVLPGGSLGFTWSNNDPYQYTWYTPQIADNTAADVHVNLGILLFNPIGHNYDEVSSTGTRPLTARVDYATFDNHIIRDDRTVPSGAPYDVKLSLPLTLSNEDVLPDKTVYTGMFRNVDPNNPNTPSPDVIIINMNTGQLLGELQNGAMVTSPPPVVNFTLDPVSGTVRLSQADVENPANNLQNAAIRVFYRTQKSYGMQVQKASAHYTQAFVNSPSPTPTAAVSYNQFYVGNTGAGGVFTRIYFPVCDAGKSVVLGQYFYADSTGALHEEDNEQY